MTERRLASWDRPTLITIYPIVADDDIEVMRYASAVEEHTFEPVNAFFERESRPYGFRLSPAFRFQVADVSNELPPEIPGMFSRLEIALWSLRMRWWTWRKAQADGLIKGDIQMFMVYRGTNGQSEVEISVGMRKGRYGIVKARASAAYNERNMVIFAHELLHVMGASDKYILSTGEPIFPHGYADPDARPLFPQSHAEIMGGRIPLSAYESSTTPSLNKARIGKITAEEIGFFNRLNDVN